MQVWANYAQFLANYSEFLQERLDNGTDLVRLEEHPLFRDLLLEIQATLEE
jgi:hypothetical protein